MELGSVFTEQHNAFLQEHGWVVVKDVVPHDLCDAAFQDIMPHFELWDESLTLDNSSAWAGKNLPAGTIHGISRCFADTQGQWEIRQYPKVVRAFADIFKVPSIFDMVTSRDAFNFYHVERPVGRSAKGFWCHVDVGSGVKGVGLDCVQGYVDLIGSEGPNDGTLVVWDKVCNNFFLYHLSILTHDRRTASTKSFSATLRWQTQRRPRATGIDSLKSLWRNSRRTGASTSQRTTPTMRNPSRCPW